MSITKKPKLNDSSYVTEFISGACHRLPMKVLKQRNTLEEFITNRGTTNLKLE